MSATGTATVQAQLVADPGDTTNPFTAFTGQFAGVDFNPVPDLAGNPSLRVITDTDENLRINVNTGNVSTDTTINPPAITMLAAAYTNVDLDPATGTSLFGYDFSGDQLVTTLSPNAGTYTPLGLSGISTDLSPDLDVQTIGSRNIAFAQLRTVSNPSKLYIVSLTNGLLLPLGDIGSNLTLTHGMAVASPGIASVQCRRLQRVRADVNRDRARASHRRQGRHGQRAREDAGWNRERGAGLHRRG